MGVMLLCLQPVDSPCSVHLICLNGLHCCCSVRRTSSPRMTKTGRRFHNSFICGHNTQISLSPFTQNLNTSNRCGTQQQQQQHARHISAVNVLQCREILQLTYDIFCNLSALYEQMGQAKLCSKVTSL